MKITEGILGYWHYHLSEDDSPTVALCGEKTMRTEMKLESWGIPFGEHFPIRPKWCKNCEEKKKETLR